MDSNTVTHTSLPGLADGFVKLSEKHFSLNLAENIVLKTRSALFAPEHQVQ
jgi:hypothetical protein